MSEEFYWSWIGRSVERIADALETLAGIAKRRDQEEAKVKDGPSLGEVLDQDSPG